MSTFLEQYSTYEEEVTGALTGITAFAGGGQASATALISKYNNVTISGADLDSVKLPAALVGKKVCVLNTDAAQTIDVFPQSGEFMDGVVNAASNIAAVGNGKIYECFFDTYWTSK